jgi:TonB family protein
MFLKLRIRPQQPQTAPHEQRYRIRLGPFGASFGLHVIVVTILASNPMSDRAEKTTLYQEMIQPQEHKIIFYNLRKELPEVKATRKIGDALQPRGTELSGQVMIAASPNAKSAKQFIWQPLPKIEIPRDLPLPNLILRANTSLPPPPPSQAPNKLERPVAVGPPSPVKNDSPANPKGDVNHAEKIDDAHQVAPSRAFVLPAAALQTRAPVAAPMLDAPAPDPWSVRTAKSSASDPLAALKLRKTFVPPPPQSHGARVPGPASMTDAPVAALAAGDSRGDRSGLPEGIGSPSLSAGVAPPPNAPLGTAASAGNANTDLAIAGLHAAGELNGSLPDGARSGRFAKAPALGEPAGGEGNGPGALTVPDLTIREEKTKPAPALVTSTNLKAVLYAETVRSIPVSTLSLPLRPSSRTIPQAIDARFEGRSVYTMVVPIENLPGYSGDWILWFAERTPRPGDTPSMRAPLPYRKLEPAGAGQSANRVERRMQIAAVIKQDGSVDRVSVLKSAALAVEQAVTQDLRSWEFKPATRGGVPVDVDVVIEIPFSLTAEVASAGTK